MTRIHSSPAPERTGRQPAAAVERLPAPALGEHLSQQISAIESSPRSVTQRRRIAALFPTRALQRMPGDHDRIQQFLSAHAGFTAVLQGFTDEMTAEEVVTRLIDQFHRRPDFDYTGNSAAGLDLTSGDCSTLVRQFVEVAQTCFGLKMTVSARLPGPLFIDGGGAIIDKGGRTGNVDHGAHWRFDDHVWAEWGSVQIDVLFGQRGLKPSVKLEEQKDGSFSFKDTAYFTTDPTASAPDHRYTSLLQERLQIQAPKQEKSFEQKRKASAGFLRTDVQEFESKGLDVEATVRALLTVCLDEKGDVDDEKENEVLELWAPWGPGKLPRQFALEAWKSWLEKQPAD